MSNDTFKDSCQPLIDFLKKAAGFLDISRHVFLRQLSDSRKMVIKKRYWIRWLIRRLLTLCLEKKEWPKVFEGCRETMTLIMKKAIVEPPLYSTLIEQYIVFLEDLGNASNILFCEPGEEYTDQQDPVKLRAFGSAWSEHNVNLEEMRDPYVDQKNSTEITLNYGHEAEMLQEVVTDILSMSFTNELNSDMELLGKEMNNLSLHCTTQKLCLLPRRLKDLWQLTTIQLNLTDTNVKKSTLELMNVLILAERMPTSVDLNNFIDLLFSLLHHFLDGKACPEGKHNYTEHSTNNSESSILLQIALSNCLDTVMSSNIKEELGIRRFKLAMKNLWNENSYFSKIPFLAMQLQISLWKGLLYLFEQSEEPESLGLPIEEIIRLAITSIKCKNQIGGNIHNSKISNDNDIKSPLLKIFSRIIQFDVTHSSAWKLTNKLKMDRGLNNQNKSSAKISTELT